MSAFDLEALLSPLAPDAPCGPPDMDHDEVYQALETAARGKPEQQFGNTVYPAEDPNWPKMRTLALSLFERTRDLRVAIHLLRASLRTQGLGALADGLDLITGLLERHWSHVYPLLDADDHDDPTERMNALTPLVDLGSVLADVRVARVPGDRTGVTGRLLELASGRVVAELHEKVPPVAALVPVLQAADAVEPGFVARLADLPAQVDRLDQLLCDRVGTAGPEFKPLRLLVRDIAQVAGAIASTASGEPATATAPHDPFMAAASPLSAMPSFSQAAMATVAIAVPGQIASRDDAIRMLGRVCEWIEHHEPSHPAPLLIRRAQRLMTKSFFEIIHDLAPDGLNSIEKIAGLSYDEATGS